MDGCSPASRAVTTLRQGWQRCAHSAQVNTGDGVGAGSQSVITRVHGAEGPGPWAERSVGSCPAALAWQLDS